MALNPFQKKCHLCSSPKSSEGLSSVQEDRQLQMAYVNLKALEDNCKNLQKEMCRYEDCISKLQEIELGLSSSMLNCGLAREDPPLRSVAECYHSVVYQMRDNTDNLKLLARKTVTEPVKKLNPEFAMIANALKKRDSALRDCSSAKAKHEKASKSPKTGQNVVRTQQAKRALEAAKEDYDTQNKLLLIEMPQFYEKRVDYFQPCLQALIRSQVNYYGETNSLFTHMSSHVAVEAAAAASGETAAAEAAEAADSNKTSDAPSTDKHYLEDISKHLTAIKSLSIVGK